MMKKAAILIIAILAFSACKKSEQKVNTMIVADWLIGSWENKLETGRLSETWTKTNDTVYSGASYFIKEKDTLSNEQIMLTQKQGELFYIPTVQGQNNNEPVIFKLTSSTAKQMVFENPLHDFPQKITYRQVNADSLVAEISGIQDGKPASETYPMARIKE
jgi:uncharacterized protein DUF6265